MTMMMTGRVLLVCALCVLWCGAAGAAADVSEERVDLSSSERSQMLQNVLSEPTDGKESLEHNSCLERLGSDVNTAECTKAKTNNSDAISTDPLSPSHAPSNPNPEKGLQPVAPPTGPVQAHQPNLMHVKGVVEEVREEDEEGKRKKELEEQNKHQNQESHENPSSREKPSVLKGNQPVGQEATLQGDSAQQGRKHQEEAPVQIQQEKDVQHRELSQHDQLLQGHQEGQEGRRPDEEQPQILKAQKEKVATASSTGPNLTQQSPPHMKINGLQQEGSAASSSEQLKEEIPSVSTESKSNGTIDPPSPQASEGEGGAPAALQTQEEDANIRQVVEFSETAAREEDHQHEHPPDNYGETTKEKPAVVTNNTANKNGGDSDGSTAVSHTTSPLLLLLVVVACTAAAAVVAA
ncbi:mucin-associated surface protein (MASP), putative [Trypanosoma cruzi]|uniref:Mucin-associated surface protein (MASP), putative n=2 Tax=Trypanosoma cruzi TaxID=5693 RepID=Q4DY06_TRYCC|nr:mucin-associated surface protein (MASP), putative [Trypanosoma cruzi]EAN97394.1 mucin-associated surface protein (MASP), putative [Trypanosoma cruzi]|eukprot:XP_819245.1 mucin-associated surface protein (MASP) [Trypanosoma cruzi strain CL Brener]